MSPWECGGKRRDLRRKERKGKKKEPGGSHLFMLHLREDGEQQHEALYSVLNLSYYFMSKVVTSVHGR